MTRNPDQQRIAFSGFESLYETFQCGGLKSDSRHFEDCISQVSKSQCLLRGSSLIALLHQIYDVTPRIHILGFVIGYSLFNYWVMFFIRPLFQKLFFLVLFVIRKQMIHNSLSTHTIFVADDFEGSRFGIDCDEFII